MGFSQNIADAARALAGRPVRNSAYERRLLEDGILLPQWFDVTGDELEQSHRLLQGEAEGEETDDSALWLLPNFTHPYGGVFTALRIADALERSGWRNTIVIYDNPAFDIKPQLPLIRRYFPALRRESFLALRGSLDDLPAARVGIATFWASAYRLMQCGVVHSKAYLIQDFEAAFYPAGTQYALAENTYRLPLHRIYNTPGLMRYIEDNYAVSGARRICFTPAVDARYFAAPRPLCEPIRILFYARPHTPRNAYELAVAFARALRHKYGDGVQLVAAGEDCGAMGGDAFEHAGVVPYDELPGFYARFHFVVSFMLTKHPSYLPLEAMAAGCCVIANTNEANDWLLKDNENCVVAMPMVSSLMDAFERALYSDTYEALVQNARRTVMGTNWDAELARIMQFLEGL